MYRGFKSVLAVAVVLSAGAFSGLGAAHAAPPETERFSFDETYVDDFFSEACGVEVTVQVSGHSTVRMFSSQGERLLENFTLNIAYTLRAGDNVYRLRDVGSDHIMMAPDGTLTITIAGQVPLDFTGMLRINLETGEVLHEPVHLTGGDLTKVCARLTA